MRKKTADAASLRVVRLLDANLNRAREGIRVVEDTARFLWDDRATYRRLRTLRHSLDSVTRSRYRRWVAARSSESDVGRRIVEGNRRSTGDVVAANIRRAQEAVRVLEEYGKLIAPKASPALKEIRYRLYVEEKRLLRKMS